MKNKYLSIYLSALTILVISVAVIYNINFSKLKPVNFNETYIAHAMGEIDGVTYTNSLDAFLFNYNKGHRVFEVDFDLLEGKLICCHDKSVFESLVENTEYNYENFMNSKLLGKYTTLDIKGLSQLLIDYEDIYIVTDTKYSDYEHVNKMFNIIKTECSQNLDRIIPQIYNQKMYDYVTNVYSFPNIIFTLYQLNNWDAEDIANFCSEKNISIVTMWYYLLNQNIANVFHNYHIVIATHTVNDESMVEELKEIGCDYFYTDSIIN